MLCIRALAPSLPCALARQLLNKAIILCHITTFFKSTFAEHRIILLFHVGRRRDAQEAPGFLAGQRMPRERPFPRALGGLCIPICPCQSLPLPLPGKPGTPQASGNGI